MDICRFHQLISITLLLCAGVTVAQEAPEGKSVAVRAPGNLPDPARRQIIESQARRYEELLHSGALDEAENLAKRRVELAISVSGTRSVEVADALTDLGIVQLRRQLYDAARQNFEAAVDMIIESENRLDALLVRPLTGLGNSHLRSGQAQLAAEVFVGAVHITHVNEGPHNAAQIELLESLAEARLQLGDSEGAKGTRDTVDALLQRHYGDDKLALVEPLMRQADWLHRAGFILEERETYRDIVQIIRSEKGRKDLSLVEPLLKLGATYLYIDSTGAQPLSGTATPTGEVYFKRAIRIIESNPDASWEISANAMVAFGDFYTIRSDFNRAQSSYMDAWQLLSEDPSRETRRDELLGQPYPLTRVSVRRYYGGDELPFDIEAEDNLLEGTVTATYAINDHGRVNNLAITEIAPPEFTEMGRHVERELRQQVFRPVLDQSGPVHAPSQLFEHQFFYTRAEWESLRARHQRTED